jgi:hypothetical protein
MQVWAALLFQVPVALKLPMDFEIGRVDVVDEDPMVLLEEVAAYEALASLQGDCIPRLIAYGTFTVGRALASDPALPAASCLLPSAIIR